MSEHPKFCTSCGAALEAGQNFCTSCGAAVASFEREEALREEKTFDNRETLVMPAKSDDTSPMPSVGGSSLSNDVSHVTKAFPMVDARNRQYRQNASSSASVAKGTGVDSNRKVLIVVLVVLAVLVCVLAGVLFATLGSGQQNNQPSSANSNQPAATDGPTSNSNVGNSTSSADSAKVSDADKELYSQLSGYYSRLESYDDRISAVAKDFNANYMSKSMSTRSSYASAASSLQESIAQDYASLKNLSVPSGSQYSSCYSAMLTCYYDCTQRIGVIVESWNNSLEYDDPTGHSDDICEPLSRDKSGDSNKYYTEFNQTLPSAKPSSPK